MFTNEEGDPSVSNRTSSGRSLNSVKIKNIDDNTPVSERKPQDDKNADNNKDKDSSINKEGRVGLITMI